MSGELLAISWRGTDEHGTGHRGRGRYTLAEIAAITERYYRRGWQMLEVLAGDGPFGDGNPVEVARIGPRPGTGERVWRAAATGIPEKEAAR